jgi:hypothetical protein
MRTTFIAIALVASLSGTAALAKQAPVDANGQSISPTTRICVVHPAITGSIIQSKQCKTAAEWQKAGVDPVKLVAKKD